MGIEHASTATGAALQRAGSKTGKGLCLHRAIRLINSDMRLSKARFCSPSSRAYGDFERRQHRAEQNFRRSSKPASLALATNKHLTMQRHFLKLFAYLWCGRQAL